RDHLLSDLIGFVYSRWNEQQAADDFIDRLQKIKTAMGNRVTESAVAIILDGENAWEHYPADGTLFLKELYARLNDNPEYEAVTVSDYLERRQEPAPKIKKIYPGSWINRNFSIWIGHQEDNLAWDYLGQARRELVLFEQQHKERIETDDELKDNINKAWEHIYIAEGSDWCWWYGDDHSSENDADFDKLFRQHLMTVYRCLKQEIPEHLNHPIIQSEKALHPDREITSFINPEINGNMSDYYEWRGAVFFDGTQLGGAMHRSEYPVKELYYGFNLENFFFRIDIERKFITEEDYHIYLNIVNGRTNKISCEIRPANNSEKLILICKNLISKQSSQIEEGAKGKSQIRFAVNSILEIAFPFDKLTLKPGDDLNFSITIKYQGHEVQRLPISGYLHLNVPGQDFEDRMWYI
ncbi:MAG: hypothetical protein J7J71_03770, partial [Deltaproteobacteria bacterium]|nr:hypothetical protein [Candidatus Tharpella sp.]